jgi:hypothetical protein
METLQRVGNPLYEAWLELADVNVESRWDLFRSTTWAKVAQAMRILDTGGEDLKDIQQLQQSLIERPWPPHMGDGSSIATHSVRRAGTRKYAWAIPNNVALTALAGLSPIVEVGAGTGYWASLLTEHGADVLAYDIVLPGEENHWHSDATNLWHPIQVGPSEVAGEHPDRTLFLSWPPYCPDENIRCSPPPEGAEGWREDTIEAGTYKSTWWKKENTTPDMALAALLAYEQAGGQWVVYIGEGSGGCTAGDVFHERLGLSCWHDEGEECDHNPAWEEASYITIPQWDGLNDGLWIMRRRG